MRWYEGYRLRGFPPGVHLGLPSTDLTVVLALDEPVDIVRAAAPGQGPGRFTALASGLATVPVAIAHSGYQHGIQLSLTPRGARALLGVPTAAIGAWIVDLADVLGADAHELLDRIAATPSWSGRFAILDRVLLRRLGRAADRGVEAPLARAWCALVADRARPVGEVADDLGWSRRYLTARFTAEYGVGPKEVARLARFTRSRLLVGAYPARRLADVAARCGYYDQAHLAREWRELAGVPPSRWREREVFPIVQDDDLLRGEHS